MSEIRLRSLKLLVEVGRFVAQYLLNLITRCASAYSLFMRPVHTYTPAPLRGPKSGWSIEGDSINSACNISRYNLSQRCLDVVEASHLHFKEQTYKSKKLKKRKLVFSTYGRCLLTSQPLTGATTDRCRQRPRGLMALSSLPVMPKTDNLLKS